MPLPVTISGSVWKLGDHINTDLLHPPAFFSLEREKIVDGLREGMERLGADRGAPLLRDTIVIVAGENFGCGSSRETSVRALSLCGVRAVVATSFARIFYRSLANLGIPPIECPMVQEAVEDGESIYIQLETGIIEVSGGRRISFSPLDPHIERIVECGGLISYLRSERDGL